MRSIARAFVKLQLAACLHQQVDRVHVDALAIL
jgi:hypothetical protein